MKHEHEPETIHLDIVTTDPPQNETESNKSKGSDSDERFDIPYWLSEGSKICRVCLEDEQLEPLISPCKCKGTLEFVHVSCLEHWLLESMTNRCELCQTPLKTQQALKYTLREAIIIWLFNKERCLGRLHANALSNIFAPPLVCFCIYFCVMIADYYYGDNLDRLPVGAITILLLFTMVCIMGLGFASWMYFKIKYQYLAWFRWWQSNLTIKIILDESESDKPTEAQPVEPEPCQETEAQAPSQAHTDDLDNAVP